MSSTVTTGSLVILTALGFTVVGSLLVAGTVAMFRRRLQALPPAQRHRTLAILAATPVLVGVSLLLAAYLPPALAAAGLAADHCRVHDHHAHLCFRHPPHGSVRPEVAVLLAGAGLVVGFRIALSLVRAMRAARVIGTLLRSGERREQLDVTVIEYPVCLAVGLLSPRVVVGRDLLDRLCDGERRVVLAHERAHVQRRDALVLAVVRLLLRLHVPATARWIEAELRVCAEQACDEAAARAVGDRIAVAEAILRLQSMSRRDVAASLAGTGLAFEQHAIERRVESLLAEPMDERFPRFAHALALGIVTFGFAAASELHHLTETIVSTVAL